MTNTKSTSTPQPLAESGSPAGEDAIFTDPDWLAAVVAESTGDYVEMLKRTKALVVRHPENAVARYALACAFAKLKFTDDAIEACRQAIKLKPDYGIAWYNLGNNYREAGRTTP